MDWPAAASIAGIGALTLALIVHVVRYAYTQGQTDQRLRTVEESVRDHGTIKDLLAGLSATVKGLEGSVAELRQAIHEIAPRTPRARS